MAEEEDVPASKKRALEDDEDNNGTKNGQGPAKKVDLKGSSE